MVGITVAVTLDDAGSGPAGFTLQSVISSQRAKTNRPGDRPVDIKDWVVGTPDTLGRLRAEQNHFARTYWLTYLGADVAGNTAKCVAKVKVPRR